MPLLISDEQLQEAGLTESALVSNSPAVFLTLVG